MITRTRARELGPSLTLFSSPPNRPPVATTTAAEEECEESSSPTSPYSLSNEDMHQLTEEFDRVEELTTSGRTYEELVNASQQEQEQQSHRSRRNSSMSEEMEESEESEEPSSLRSKKNGRQSMGFMLGRNSLSNWSSVGGGGGLLNDHHGGNHGDDIPSSVHMDLMDTGRKSNVSRHTLTSETPNIMNASNVNVSQRRSIHINTSRGSRGQRSNGNTCLSRPTHKVASAVRRRSNSLNLSHISSSSSSGMDVSGESNLGESWSPIRTSLENSFANSAVNGRRDNGMRSSIGGKESGSLSPIRDRMSNSLSPQKLSPKMANDTGAVSGMSLTPNKASEKRKSPIGANRSGRLSLIRGRTPSGLSPKKVSPKKLSLMEGKSKSPTRRRPLSLKGSPTKEKSPVRSPLGDISPNCSPTRGRLLKKGAASPERNYGTTTSMISPKKKALSPNGTYSLEEAEDNRLSMPTTAMEILGSNSSSSMSVSLGSETTTSSARLMRESTSKEKLALSLRSKGLENVEAKQNACMAHHGATAVAVRQEDTETIMRSPEKSSTKGHARSPAPTPNSQRRVIKRFRASLPAASYLMQKDLMEESMEMNPNRNEDMVEGSSEENPSKKEDAFESSLENNSNGKENVFESSSEKNSSRNKNVFEDSLENNPIRKDSGMEASFENNPNRKENMLDDSAEGTAVALKETDVAHHDSCQVAKPMEVEEPAELTTLLQASYENAFEFPSNKSIPIPRTKTLRLFHDKAISNGSPSHQYQLNRARTNFLSLQEVILPSIAYETNAVLKKKQAKAQRNVKDEMSDSEGKEVVKAIEACRKVVIKCTVNAGKVVGEAWRERENERERLWLENFQKEEEQQRLEELQAKKERKEARARSRQRRSERQKREKQMNHPRNKELWQEVAKLMVDIQKLEREERLWKEALVEVDRLEEHHQPPEKIEFGLIVDKEKDKLVNNVEDANLESTATTLVEDVTMATERINWMLESVSLAMEESDRLRKEAYEKYQHDGHKFYGYPQVDDSKGLFMALSMESP